MGHDGAERLDAGEIREKRFRWLYPPTLQSVHETRVAAILHPLLFLLAFTTAIMLGSTIFVSWIPVFQSFMLATIFCGFLGLHFFLRQGRVRLVSWSTVILVIASGITASILDPTDSVYPLPFIIGIALAGLTMGPRAPLFLASISALWLGLINFGQIAGWFVLDRPVELFEVIISQLFLVLLMGATMTVANIALKRAFEMVDSKEAAQRRLESNLAESQKLDAIGRVAGGFAHDFNNLLGVVMVNADFLRDETLTKEGQQSVDDIFTASESGSVLTSKMLALGRKQVVQSRILDPGVLLSEFSSVLGHMAGRQMRVELECPPNLGQIKVDPNQLQQILSNLVINASHASPPESVIQVQLSRQTLDQPLTGTPDQIKPGEYLCLKVTDTGTGMDEHTLSAAFEPFFTTKPSERGSGLGLSVVLGVVRQSGGHITVKTKLGEGTEFSLWFPAVKTTKTWEPPPIRKTANTKSATALQGAKILFVDDDTALRNGVVQVLRNAGADAEEFAGGAEALAHMRQQETFPDLLLTDVMMPNMTGPELFIQLSALGYTGPVVYITGYAGSEAMQEHLDRADSVLRKPVAPADLVNHLRQCLDQREQPTPQK